MGGRATLESPRHYRFAKNVVVCGDVEMTASVTERLETVLQVHLEKNPLGSGINSTHVQSAPVFVHVTEDDEDGTIVFSMIDG
jgi:hypothetical protein